MRTRPIAAGAALWSVGYLCMYGFLIDDLGDSGPAWWYVGAVSVAALLLIAVAAGRAGRRTLIAALVILALSAFVGILTIGIFLVPAVIAVAIAVINGPPRATPPPSPLQVPRADS